MDSLRGGDCVSLILGLAQCWIGALSVFVEWRSEWMMFLLVRLHIRGVKTEGEAAVVKTFAGKCSLPFRTLFFHRAVNMSTCFCLCGRTHFFKVLSHIVQVECVCNTWGNFILGHLSWSFSNLISVWKLLWITDKDIFPIHLFPCFILCNITLIPLNLRILKVPCRIIKTDGYILRPNFLQFFLFS